MVKYFPRLDVRKFSFFHGVVNEWNSLPEWAINSTSINSFNDKIDKLYCDCGRIWLCCPLLGISLVRVYFGFGMQGILWGLCLSLLLNICLEPDIFFRLS